MPELRLRARLVFAVALAVAPVVTAAAQPAATFDECDALVRRAPREPASYRCYNFVTRDGRGTLHEAIARLTSYTLLDPENAPAWLALGQAHDRDGRRPEAEAAYGHAIAAYDRRGDAYGRVLARTSLASLLQRADREDDSETPLDEAQAIASVDGRSELTVRTAVSKAWLAYRRLDYGGALRLLDAVAGGLDAVPYDAHSDWLSARAATLWALGQHPDAKALYLRQADLLHASGDFHEEAIARVNVLLFVSGDEKVRLAQEALHLARRAGNRRAEASAHYYLAEATPGEESRAHARRAIEINVAIGHPEGLLRARRVLAFRTLDVDPEQAFTLIDASIDDARRSGDANELVRQWVLRTSMRWRVGPREQAIADAQTTLGLIEALRNLQPETDIRAMRFAQWRGQYYLLAGRLLAGELREHADPEAIARDRQLAFETIERLRARSLLDRLDAAAATGQLLSDDPLHAERRDVLARLARANRELADRRLSDDARRERLAARDALEREEARLSAELTRRDPVFASTVEPHLASIEALRRALAPDEAIVVLHLVSNLWDVQRQPIGAWGWAITRTQAEVRPLPDVRYLSSAVDLFLGLLERRDGSEAIASTGIYRDYLAPLVESLPDGITKLVVVPDDALHRVPLDVLRATADGEPLGVRFQMSLAPSASVWLRWRQQPFDLAAEPVLALADPAFSGRDEAVVAALERASGTGVPVGQLPYARVEARALVREAGRGSRVLDGARASEHFVKTGGIDRYRILHLAAHALVDEEQPARTAVLLAPGSETEDGLLQLREVVGLGLGGRVVVLSACRSASGRFIPGEGLMGLAHGFFQAGARAVVANLWPVRDAEAADIVQRLYFHLGRGESLGAAVAAARRELMLAGRPAAAWSGLVVIGDAEVVPIPGGAAPAWPWWGGVVVALVGVSAGGWWWERHRRSREVAS